MAGTSSKNHRVTARVTADVRRTIERAADLTGATVNQFLVQSALERAQELIREEQIISLSSRDAETFLGALERPPKPSRALRRAAQRLTRTLPDDAD